MEKLRLTETQAKQLADRKARQSRAKSKFGGNVKWAVLGVVLGLILVALLSIGKPQHNDQASSDGSTSSSIDAPASINAPEDVAPGGNDNNNEEEGSVDVALPETTASPTFAPFQKKQSKETQPPNNEATTPPEEETLEPKPEEDNASPIAANDTIIHDNVDGSNSYWGLNQHEETTTSTTTIPATDIPASTETPIDGENININNNNNNSQTVDPSTLPSDEPSIVASENPSSTPSAGTSSNSPSAAPTADIISDIEQGDLDTQENETSQALPSVAPSVAPSSSPSNFTNDEDSLPPKESRAPSIGPSLTPSWSPSDSTNSEAPSTAPSYGPSYFPSARPSAVPTASPSAVPTESGKGMIWGFDEPDDTTASQPAETPSSPSDTNSQEQATTASPSASPTVTSDLLPEDTEGTGEEGDEEEEEVTENAAPSEEEEAEEEDGQVQSITEPYQYRRRGRPVEPGEAQQLAQEWGEWTLVDPKADQRPTDDYCGAYRNRDIPREAFPADAWQVDEEYVAKFLSEGKELVQRAMEVHLAEYGFGPDDLPGEDFETRRDKSPFLLEIVQEGDAEHLRRLSTGVNDRAGWSPQKSFDGLVRRLLHAVVSGSDFNLVLGGHSAAAGHGNHFQQSYSLQFQRVMEPVFARLGVKHYSRNTGMGGLGTIQSAMGARDLYGSNVDILIWDSSMTEPSKTPDFDLFIRQGILGSDRAPMLWSGIDETKLLPTLQEHADIDFMMYGTGLGPIPSITDPTKIDEIPWAARYIKCDNDYHDLCNDNRCNGTCWIERPDHFVPPTPQNGELGGKASWHEGNRVHQLYGRVLSFTVLTALHEALDFWDRQPQHKLSDDMWHMSDYYKNIQSKIANLDKEIGLCYQAGKKMSTAFCTTTFQSKSEFTPRANPEETSIRSIMKPFGPDASIPQPEVNIYDPPDVYNPTIGVPKGAVDYLAIIENGVDYRMFRAPKPLPRRTETNNRLIELTVDDKGEAIVPGLGWGINTKASPNLCNGTYDSFCGRSVDHKCLLYGHNDYRGGLTFDSLSGWGIFTLRNLEKGMIFVKMDSWRPAKDNPVTEGWTEENNGQGVRSLLTSKEGSPDRQQHTAPGNVRRRAKDDDNAKFCPDFLLEFAFGDQIVRLKYDEILGERHSLVQRVVQIWTVLDDAEFTNGETVDIELGIRLRGCQRQHVFWLSTIYWA